MKKPNVSSLRQGQTVYYVHALQKSSFVTEYFLLGKPYQNGGLGLFISAMGRNKYADEGWLQDHFSLKDCNVIKNKYNKHRLFYSRKKAESYKQRCIREA